MIHNPVIDAMMNRRSIRKYTGRIPTEEEILTVVRAGQQAPFAMQMGSVIIQRNSESNAFNAPIQFVILCDIHRMERVMERRAGQGGHPTPTACFRGAGRGVHGPEHGHRR